MFVSLVTFPVPPLANKASFGSSNTSDRSLIIIIV